MFQTIAPGLLMPKLSYAKSLSGESQDEADWHVPIWMVPSTQLREQRLMVIATRLVAAITHRIQVEEQVWGNQRHVSTLKKPPF